MKVKTKGVLTRGAELIPTGSELELPDEEAKALIALGVVEPIEAKEEKGKR